MPYRLSALAEQDLDEIWSYVAEDASPATADRLIDAITDRLEFGQGVHTALPLLLADELDADWSQVVAELAPAADIYRDPVRGMQMVGGSGSIATSFQQYRELGARTRAMLVAAAAERWKVAPDQCRTEASVVHGPTRQSASYAELATDAALVAVDDKAARTGKRYRSLPLVVVHLRLWSRSAGAAPSRRSGPSDVVWFPPGEKHWHGASPATAMTHIAIQEKLDGKAVDWLEHVSAEQYEGRSGAG